MQGSTFDPQNETQFLKSKVQINFVGVRDQCLAGQTKTLDYTLTDDHLLVGLMVACKGHVFGDYMDVTVMVGEAVVGSFVMNWLVFDDQQLQVNEQAKFPAKLLTGMKIRVTYHSTGGAPVDIIVNYKLHKVLV